MTNIRWEFTSNLSQFQAQFSNAQRQTLEAIGQYVEGESKLRCPVGQYDDGRVGGNLRSSIKNSINGDNSVDIGTNVEYAGYVEKGTSKMKAQPYLTPAVEENKSNIEMIARQIFGGLGE